MCTQMTSKKSTAHPCTHRVGRALLTNDTSKKTTAHPCTHRVGRALRTNDTNYARMCTLRIYHRNPQPTHANTESTKSCMQTSQTIQHEEALCTMCTMRTCQRNRDTCPYTVSMSLLHPPTTLLWKAVSYVEASSTNRQNHQAFPSRAAA